MSSPIPGLVILLGIIAVAVACSGGDSNFVPTPTPRPATESSSANTSQARPTPTSGAALSITAETIAAGRTLFTGGGGCAACHTIEGLTHGVLGPDLDGIATVASARIPGYTAERYLREAIVDSCAYTVEGTDCNLMLNVMNTIHLTDADVDALVAFLLQQR